MICAVIKGPTVKDAEKEIAEWQSVADMVELRLDFFQGLDLAALQDLLLRLSLPVILTLRSAKQGGHDRQSEQERHKMLGRLAKLQPSYLDIDSHTAPSLVTDIQRQHPEVKLILSDHNFVDTPEDIESLYLRMRQIPAVWYKIATTARTTTDALRLLNWSKEHTNVIPISMGRHGEISRILAPWARVPWTYVAKDSDCGQLPAEVLIERYHYRTLTPQTKLYGLIGTPICQSIGDRTHNSLFQKYALNAVYIKLEVEPHALGQFLEQAAKLPFQGLSVTMPLKELACQLVATAASTGGALNTLMWDKRWIGHNTDGKGALNAIEGVQRVDQKHIVLIGAGGSARAIAYEALQRGAKVTLVNRHKARAEQLAKELGLAAVGIEDMPRLAKAGYDILINSTPSGLPIDVSDILPSALIMDITTQPKETLLLQAAKQKGCRLIYGYHMFIEQALGQFEMWFRGSLPIEECRFFLQAYIQNLHL